MITALGGLPAARRPAAVSAWSRCGNAMPPSPSAPMRRKLRRETPSQKPLWAGFGPKMFSRDGSRTAAVVINSSLFALYRARPQVSRAAERRYLWRGRPHFSPHCTGDGRCMGRPFSGLKATDCRGKTSDAARGSGLRENLNFPRKATARFGDDRLPAWESCREALSWADIMQKTTTQGSPFAGICSGFSIGRTKPPLSGRACRSLLPPGIQFRIYARNGDRGGSLRDGSGPPFQSSC